MELSEKWESFWKEYRNKEVESEDDLYFQVARTINKKPIPKEVFDALNQNIIANLQLNANDILVELCCGNGLSTYELREHAKQIIAEDFAPHLIETANRFKSAPNISYHLASAFDFLENFKSEWSVVPNKYLMNDAVANFSPADLRRILVQIKQISGEDFTFLITGAPNDALKWNFYNTDERKNKYHELVAKGDNWNDGIGRWWKAEDVAEICASLNLPYTVRNQGMPFSNYRMDIIIKGS